VENHTEVALHFSLLLSASQEEQLSGIVHVVDDDASFRTAIERRLKRAGYAVVTYSSAQQLLDRLPADNEPSASCSTSGYRD
jgi:CheY-like chemotaxis protein